MDLNSVISKIERRLKYHLDYIGERVVPTEMHADPDTWIQHLSRYIFALKYATRREILDVACGTGYGSAILSSLARKVVGIDINEKAIKWARINNTFYCPSIFIVRDVEHQFISGKFDTIVCFETIEHLSHPEEFLDALRTKNSKPDTILIFSTPLKDRPNKFHKQRFDWNSLQKITKSVLGNNIEWYSQIDHIIQREKTPKAKFAIGVWMQNERV